MKRNNLLKFFGFVLFIFSFFAFSKVGVEDFFRKTAISNATLSPSGEIVVYEKFNRIVVKNLTSEAIDLFGVDRDYYISSINWTGDDSFIVMTRRRADGFKLFIAMRIAVDKDGGSVSLQEYRTHKYNGYIVDPLIDNAGQILFAKYSREDDVVYSDVFRVSLFAKNKLQKRKRINRDSEEIISWLTGSNHKLSIGVSYVKGIPSLWALDGTSRNFKNIWSASTKSKFTLYGLSLDKKILWVKTDANTDTEVAVGFNLETLKFEETIWESKGIDVNNILFDENTGTPIGVNYFEKGTLKYDFFDEAFDFKYRKLAENHPQEKLHILDFSLATNNHLIVSTSTQSPGKLLKCNLSTTNCDEVGSLFPWLDSVELAETVSFTTLVDNEFEIESYLTLPVRKAKKYPLIVMPHGGPIGVRDNSYFSGDVQWLSSKGFAVLQVNYRGSSGFGKKFKFKGMQQWGRAIEDDIEASLLNALKKQPSLDRSRVAIFGASYGGYSALLGVIRSPELYKCAISFAGVTDLSLLFNKSSIKNNHQLTASLKEIVGDPLLKRDELMEYSPVYQYKRIGRPVMLLHGEDDERVDIEHTWRLKSLLEYNDMPIEYKVFKNVGHSFRRTDEIKRFYDYVMPFLTKHLLI